MPDPDHVCLLLLPQALFEHVSDEAELVRTLTDALGYLLKTERAAFLPLLEGELLDLLQALLGEDGQNPPSLVSVAVCLFDDCIEVRGRQAPQHRACATSPSSHFRAAGY